MTAFLPKIAGGIALAVVACSAVAGCTGSSSDAAPSQGTQDSSRSSSTAAPPAPATPGPTTTTGASTVPGGQGGSGQPTRGSTSAHSSRSGSPSGTSSSAAPPAQSSAIEVPAPNQICKIVSAEAVGSAFHARVRSQSSSVGGTGSQLCHFGLAAGNVRAPGTLSIASAQGSAKSFSSGKAGTKDAQSVPGVGDDAYYAPSRTTIAVRGGNSVVVIEAAMGAPGAPRPDAARLKADLVTLARVIAHDL